MSAGISDSGPTGYQVQDLSCYCVSYSTSGWNFQVLSDKIFQTTSMDCAGLVNLIHCEIYLNMCVSLSEVCRGVIEMLKCYVARCCAITL